MQTEEGRSHDMTFHPNVRRAGCDIWLNVDCYFPCPNLECLANDARIEDNEESWSVDMYAICSRGGCSITRCELSIDQIEEQSFHSIYL